MKKVFVEKDAYHDSVFLMSISREVKITEGVIDASVSMGTDSNKALLTEQGFLLPEDTKPNDLIIAVESESAAVCKSAFNSARELLQKKQRRVHADEEYHPVNLETAFKMIPDANLVIISIPGVYAVREAKQALENGRHVLLFSDNVSIEEEIKLKEYALSKGLLMMGPDCGTAIINGKPLGFANVVRPGDIGIVGASGTGIQEVTCRIDQLGGGISQAVGTGGRDLEAGGTMMLLGIEALMNDPETAVIAVISKPPPEDTAWKVVEKLRDAEKPCVVHFIGISKIKSSGNLQYAGNLEETARMACAMSQGKTRRPFTYETSSPEWDRLVMRETSGMSENQRYVRGLFTGGTLAEEALHLFETGGAEKVYSNVQTKQGLVLKDPNASKEHTIVDLGDDFFTARRPHSMIDPGLREERINREMKDQDVALILLDMVLGYGSHEDPAGAITRSLKEAKKMAEDRGGYLSIVASITGTDRDFQNIEDQRRKLESVGCVVMPSNYQASMLALDIIKRRQDFGCKKNK